MRRVVLLLIVLLLGMSGCESDETRMSKLANEYCNCFQVANEVLSEESIKFFENRTTSLGDTTELGPVDSAASEKARREFAAMGEIKDRELPGECIERLMRSHGFERELTDKAKLKELIELLEMRSECRMAVLFLKAAYDTPEFE
jgi:hypothetical protein